jgi:hypothetical protein
LKPFGAWSLSLELNTVSNHCLVYLNIVRYDLFHMLKWIRHKDKIGGGTNSYFLTLIMKENHPLQDLGLFYYVIQPIRLSPKSWQIVSKRYG